jgi:replicative DNA helicase
MDVSDLNVTGLRSIVKRRMLESDGKLKLVVVDYLQLLGGGRADMNEYEKVSEISRVLKVLARELRIPVLALSQMSRDSEKGATSTPREPRLSDLRGSGTIEQDADAVLFIHRVDQQGDGQDQPCRKMKVIIAKNRFGPTGWTPMHFFPAKMAFTQAPREEYVEPEDEAPMAARANGRPPRRDKIESAPKDDEDLFQ